MTYCKKNENPFIKAIQPELSRNEFLKEIKGNISDPIPKVNESSQNRLNYLTNLSTWFFPMDYMYVIYDTLYRAITSTYKTKTVIETIRKINQINNQFQTEDYGMENFSTQAYSGAILGVPGIGKSSTIQRCLRLIPQKIVHTNYNGQPFYTKQITYLFIECPSDCSVKTLALNIFTAVDRCIGSHYMDQIQSPRASSSSALVSKLKILCLNLNIGLIVIDEIQNAVYSAEKNRQIKPLIKFLVELTNETSTAICFCGTLEAENLFLQKEHLTRRTRGIRLYPMKYDITYRKMMIELWKHQSVKKKTHITEKLLKQVYDLSGGIPSYIIKIFQEAQTHAILTGKEMLDYEIIKQTANILNIEVPKYYDNEGTSITDFQYIEDEIDLKIETEPIVTEVPENKLEIDTRIIVEENKRNEIVHQVEKMPPRFYSTNRGRKKEVRDESDILECRSNMKDIKDFILVLEQKNLLEKVKNV